LILRVFKVGGVSLFVTCLKSNSFLREFCVTEFECERLTSEAEALNELSLMFDLMANF